MKGLTGVIFNLLIAGFFLVILYHLEGITEISKEEWDLQTITAGDYTTEYIIDEEQWLNFIPNDEEVPKLHSFNNKLIGDFEEMVTARPKIHREADLCRISMVSYAFDNRSILKLLRKRGEALMYTKFSQAKVYQSELEGELKNNREMIRRPVAAYITWETEEGRNRAIQKPADDEMWMNRPFAMKEAPEPDDIIWENAHITPKSHWMKLGVVCLFVLILCLMGYSIIFAFLRGREGTPHSEVACSALNTIYPSEASKLKEAMTDYRDMVEGSKFDYSMNTIDCFCSSKAKLSTW